MPQHEQFKFDVGSILGWKQGSELGLYLGLLVGQLCLAVQKAPDGGLSPRVGQGWRLRLGGHAGRSATVASTDWLSRSSLRSRKNVRGVMTLSLLVANVRGALGDRDPRGGRGRGRDFRAV